jgi:hypothetical protein
MHQKESKHCISPHAEDVQFNINGYSMPVFYYSPRDLKKLFQSKFKLVETHPAGLFIPPSYLEKQFSKRRSG